MMPRVLTRVLIGTLLFGGCSNPSASPQKGENVTLSFGVAAHSSTDLATTAVTIESAKILLKNITFHRFPSDDGQDIKTGPLVVLLNLNGSLNTVAASRVASGQYDRVRFILHKPEDLEPIPDPEFRDGESGSLRYSTIVRGTYEGRPFVYKSRINAQQEVRFTSPITVPEDGVVNVTLVVDPGSWFVHNGATLDPADPSNADTIDEAIKASFRNAFRDDNRDGRADDR